MKLYRAIPKENMSDKTYKRLPTKRAPTNIPYVVDNIWEYLRPEMFPSRRHAAYASPTRQLALENASAVTKDGYIVTEVVFSNTNYKIAHIQVSDARFHKDVKAIANCVINHLGKDFTNLSLKEKSTHSALFLPGVSKEELQDYFNLNEFNKSLEEKIKEISVFWSEASLTPQEHDGELFFEIMGDCEYKLNDSNLFTLK